MTRPRPDVELLAALDAGVLDGGGADQARDALADPSARPVLDALAATRAELAQLPDPPVPAAVAARWSAALRAELAQPTEPGGPRTPTDTIASDGCGGPEADTAATPAPVDRRERRAPLGTEPTVDRPGGGPPGRSGPDGTRRSGRRPRAWRRPAVVAAVALAVVAVASTFWEHRGEPTRQPDLTGDGLRSIGIHDAGAYADGTRRAACLAALDPPDTAPTAPLLGGRQVTFAGRPGVVLVLGTGRRGVLDVVVVDPGCTTLLAAGLVGR